MAGIGDHEEGRTRDEVEEPTPYELHRVFEVAGRQGIATDGRHYFVSGSTALLIYSKDGELEAENTDPFVDLDKPANHIGDISVFEGIDFDHEAGEMLVLANRGKRIVLGMPKGLYPGYEREIHEVYVYRTPGASHVQRCGKLTAP